MAISVYWFICLLILQPIRFILSGDWHSTMVFVMMQHRECCSEHRAAEIVMHQWRKGCTVSHIARNINALIKDNWKVVECVMIPCGNILFVADLAISEDNRPIWDPIQALLQGKGRQGWEAKGSKKGISEEKQGWIHGGSDRSNCPPPRTGLGGFVWHKFLSRQFIRIHCVIYTAAKIECIFAYFVFVTEERWAKCSMLKDAHLKLRDTSNSRVEFQAR